MDGALISHFRDNICASFNTNDHKFINKTNICHQHKENKSHLSSIPKINNTFFLPAYSCRTFCTSYSTGVLTRYNKHFFDILNINLNSFKKDSFKQWHHISYINYSNLCPAYIIIILMNDWQYSYTKH